MAKLWGHLPKELAAQENIKIWEKFPTTSQLDRDSNMSVFTARCYTERGIAMALQLASSQLSAGYCEFGSWLVSRVVSVACPCLSAANRRLADVWFSRSQPIALGQWGAGDIKICGAEQE